MHGFGTIAWAARPSTDHCTTELGQQAMTSRVRGSRTSGTGTARGRWRQTTGRIPCGAGAAGRTRNGP
eukprot:11056968-Lingulodinium_polyedra.AAC.1